MNPIATAPGTGLLATAHIAYIPRSETKLLALFVLLYASGTQIILADGKHVTPDSWRQNQASLHEHLHREPSPRAAFDAACGDDADLRADQDLQTSYKTNFWLSA